MSIKLGMQENSSSLRPESGMYSRIMAVDSYIACYVSLSKLKFSLIVKLGALPCFNILLSSREVSRDHFVKVW